MQHPELEVLDCARGMASFHVSHSAVATVANLKNRLNSGHAILYGRCPTGEPDEKAKAAKAIENAYPYGTLDPQRIAFFPGAQFGIMALMRGWLEQTEPSEPVTVFVPSPGYANYETLFHEARKGAERTHATARFHPLDISVKGCISAADIEPIPPTRSLLILTIPSNPEGAIPTMRAQRALIKSVLAKEKLTLVLDESFMEMDFREGHPSRFQSLLHTAETMAQEGEITADQLEKLLDKTAVIRSGTKAAAMAGERPNMLVLPNDAALADRINSATGLLLGNTPFTTQQLMSDYVSQLSYQQMSQLSHYYQKNRDIVTSALHEADIDTSSPEGGFFMLADLHRWMGKIVPQKLRARLPKDQDFSVIENDTQLATLLLCAGDGNTRLGVMPASPFGYPADAGKIRLCFGPDAATLEKACMVITHLAQQMECQPRVAPGQISKTP